MIYLEMRDPNFYRNVSKPTTDSPVWRVSIDQPCPVVMASGMRSSMAWLISDRPIPLPSSELLAAEPEDSPVLKKTKGKAKGD
jgi:hypothetical protein